MEENILEKSIGTKEFETLKPTQVVITGVKIVRAPADETKKKIGEILRLICKHPDRDEPIEISEVKYLKNDTMKYSGLWINLDEEKNIQKGSALAILLEYLKVKNIKELEGKSAQTDLDKNGFLCVKAY